MTFFYAYQIYLNIYFFPFIMTHCLPLKNSSYLEIFIGPMFSGKTSKLIDVYNHCLLLNIPVAAINFFKDVRYGKDVISTHKNIQIPCLMCSEFLHDLYNPDGRDICNTEDQISKRLPTEQNISDAKVILINEAQFFNDLDTWVQKMLTSKHKPNIFIAGLDGDSNRDKFGKILDLVPFCDKITKLTSFCTHCNQNKLAIFSHRLSNHNSQQQLIGNSNKYMPLCRTCFEKLNTI